MHPENKLTAVKLLVHHGIDLAGVHGANGLRLERSAVLAGVEHAGRVHGALQRIALPAKEVVGVGAEAASIAVAEDEGVAAIRGPVIGELLGVPERLVGDLGHADGVRSRAGAAVLERLLDRVVHVRLVVGRVEVLAIPAAVFVLCQPREVSGRLFS